MESESQPDEKRADPFESFWISMLLVGGIFIAFAIVRLVSYLWGVALRPLLRPIWEWIYEWWTGRPLVWVSRQYDPEGLWRVVAALTIFAILSGAFVSLGRRFFRNRSWEFKNRVSGITVGVLYGASCVYFFGEGMAVGSKLLIGALAAGGIGWAFTSGLNETSL